MLSWVNRFNIFCLLDNHKYKLPYHSEECLLAAGTLSVFEAGADFFTSLTVYLDNNNDWIFGHFNYDLKNKIEDLESNHPDNIGFDDAFLFVPEVVIKIAGETILIGVFDGSAAQIYKEINKEQPTTAVSPPVVFQPRISKEEYIKIIEQLRTHIKRGDCYEINFCQEFYSENASMDPLNVYNNLSDISPNPFSAFYKNNNKFLICSSPERYIKKTKKFIVSQPIKGTSKRDLSNIQTDNDLKSHLLESAKERSENIMIVDLVRNDLSKICKEGTVEVESLYNVHTFPSVHQMISTIKGQLKDDIKLPDILKATFPMGSMTGAPKNRVMELIEQYEKTKRGIYSGTVGYITPDKDFDFNVVIRSLMYNAATRYLSYQVGGGITYKSDPEKEYEECLVKTQAIKKAL